MSITIMCGVCEQPAKIHPILPSDNTFAIPCARMPEDIGPTSNGQRLWWNDVTVLSTKVTEFTEDPAYIEVLKTVDLGATKQSYRPSRIKSLETQDYVEYDGVVTIPQDVAGSEAQSGSDLIKHRDATADYGVFGIGADDEPYVHQDDAHSEQSKLDRWRDNTYQVYYRTLDLPNGTSIQVKSRETWIGTATDQMEPGEYEYAIAYEYTLNPQTGGYFTNPIKSCRKLDEDESITKEQRNAYVEGNEGFLSLHLLDEQLTKKYHARLLNVFLDKNTGHVRIGSIRIIQMQDGWIKAKCVNNNCGPVFGKTAELMLHVPTATREQMENFVWSCVAHGNNHAAAFIRNREDFHKVHNLGCTLEAEGCAANDKQVCKHNSFSDHAESLNEVEFLMEHQSFCKDKRCTCSARLEELVGDLNVNAHVYASAS